MASLCAEPYCAVILDKPGRCPEHRRGRASSGTAGYGHRWRRLRNEYIAQYPICQAVLPNGQRCRAVVVDVHHVDNARPGDATFYDWRNLSSRCRSCHRRDTEHAKGT